jgi:hypothetical protein
MQNDRMRADEMSADEWAVEEFGRVQLGDLRRNERLVRMARRAAETPSGCVSEVFRSKAEVEGAYDFLESEKTSYEPLVEAMGAAAARRSVGHAYTVVPLDHCSLTMLEKTHDPKGEKNFGAVGPHRHGVRGMHAVTALALTPSGVPLGVAGLRYWSRSLAPLGRSCRERKLVKLDETELGHWAEVMTKIRAQFAEHAPSVTPWFQMDRGGDGWRLLRFLNDGGYHFTVRARSNRCVLDEYGQPRHALEILRTSKIQGVMYVNVPASDDRAARQARLRVRAAPVTLAMRNPHAWRPVLMPVWAVWVREEGTTPTHETPIEWLLWTRQEAATFDSAVLVVRTYALRWRIEELHKTWKSGACNVERMHLYRVERAAKWATVLAAVAARIERMKQLAREEPDLPASVELHPYEIRALVLLKRRYKARNEEVPDSPTIGQAVRWTADLGGYTGQRSAGPPGSKTIGRGLEKVCMAAALLEALEMERNPR